MSDSRTTTITETRMTMADSWKLHKQQMLDYDKQWEESLKMMDGQLMITEVQRDYLGGVIDLMIMMFESAPKDELIASLEKFGTLEKLVGKPQMVNGEKYQPVVELPRVITTSGKKLDLGTIGLTRLKAIKKRYNELCNDVDDMTEVRPSLCWKRKFYRYGYNLDIEKMKKYHQKISEYEASRLDSIMEQDVDGSLGKVVFHSVEAIETKGKSLLDIGKQMMYESHKNYRKGDGQFVREYSDRIKNAYEIREQMIRMTKEFKETPAEEQKHTTFIMKTVENVTEEGSIPNLI